MSIGKSIFLVLTLLSSIYANEGPIGAKAVVSNKNVVIGDNERITHMPVYNQGELKRECTTLTLTFAPKKDMTIPSYLPKGEHRWIFLLYSQLPEVF